MLKRRVPREKIVLEKKKPRKEVVKIVEIGKDPRSDSCMETNAGGHPGTLANNR